MRYGKAFIGLFTVLLILAALVFGINEYAWDGTVGLTALLSAQGSREQLQLWQRDKDDFCLFLFRRDRHRNIFYIQQRQFSQCSRSNSSLDVVLGCWRR